MLADRCVLSGGTGRGVTPSPSYTYPILRECKADSAKTVQNHICTLAVSSFAHPFLKLNFNSSDMSLLTSGEERYIL